jgi:hypothetical protein
MSNPRALRYRRLALAERDNADLLRKIADECDRGVLFTADWISARGIGRKEKPPPIPPSDAES